MLLGRLLPRGGCSGGAALGPLCARAAIAVARQQAPAAVRRVATLPRPPAARLRQCVPMAPRVTAPARGAAVMTIVGRLGTILAARVGVKLWRRLSPKTQERIQKVFNRWTMGGLAAFAVTTFTGFIMYHLETNPITGRRQLVLLSEEKMMAAALGARNQMLQPYRDLLAQSGDPDLELVLRIMRRLARNPAAQLYDWHVCVVRDPEVVNAMALPFGHVIVFTGILDFAERDEDMLAFLLAHEMGHVIGSHGMETVSRNSVLSMVTMVFYMSMFVFFGDMFTLSTIFSWASEHLAGIFTSLRYSRYLEREADELGIYMMAEGCFDPKKAPLIWKKMMEVDDLDFDFLSTHPAHTRRFQHLNELLPDVLDSSDPRCHQTASNVQRFLHHMLELNPFWRNQGPSIVEPSAAAPPTTAE